MQERASGAIHGAGDLAVQGQNVAGLAGRVVQIDVGEAFPAAADADDLAIVFRTAVYRAFNDGIQPRDVAAAGEDSNTFVWHKKLLL